MKSLEELYDPLPDEISGQEQDFVNWFSDQYTSPDGVFVYQNKIFAGRTGSSIHIFGRVGAADWEHMDERHFSSTDEAITWFEKFPRALDGADMY
jgi:hypothetical protein